MGPEVHAHRLHHELLQARPHGELRHLLEHWIPALLAASLILLAPRAATAQAGPVQNTPEGRRYGTSAHPPQSSYNGRIVQQPVAPPAPAVQSTPDGGRHYQTPENLPPTIGHTGCPGCRDPWVVPYFNVGPQLVPPTRPPLHPAPHPTPPGPVTRPAPRPVAAPPAAPAAPQRTAP